MIFEQHLNNFEDPDADRRTFIAQIVTDYLTYLRRMRLAIPREYEHLIIEELGAQVNGMLTRKTYGCVNIEEYRQKLSTDVKALVDKNYTRMIKRRA